MKKQLFRSSCAMSLALMASVAGAKCVDITAVELKNAYDAASAAITGGYQAKLGLNMWLAFVDETGKVCRLHTKSPGPLVGNRTFLAGRVEAAQKAATANAFSMDGYAVSTANLFAAVQNNQFLFGLPLSNPVDAGVSYIGAPGNFGRTNSDPLVGKRIGGVSVSGGGLAVYTPLTHRKVGAIGVAGDTPCRNHAFAWQVRANLKTSKSPTGMHPINNGQYLPSAAGDTNGAGTDKGTGITTYNIDDSGADQAFTGAIYGDEMILSSSSPLSVYWQSNWSHPSCPGVGLITNLPGNGILKNE